jgi:hypothetical protein
MPRSSDTWARPAVRLGGAASGGEDSGAGGMRTNRYCTVLYSYWTRTVLYCTHTVHKQVVYCTVLILDSYCTHTVLILCTNRYHSYTIHCALYTVHYTR